MTSVPAQLHRRLREAADGEGRFKGDVVVEALRTHGSTLTRPHVRPSRRRARVEDATQCQLYLTDAERQEIDELAQRLGLSRSGLVTLLLERALTSS
jgi:hypothetical protein